MIIEKPFLSMDRAFDFQRFLEKEGFKTECTERTDEGAVPRLWIIKGTKEGKNGK